MKRVRWFVFSALLAAISAAAWADGPSRPATKAERDYSLGTMTALSQALPKPLSGFEVREAAKLAPFDRVTPGSETEPLRVDYSAVWVNPKQAEKERAQENESIARAASRLKDPSMQAQQKAIADKQNKLAAEFGKAIEQKDNARAENLMKEMQKAGKELEKLGQAQTAVLREETRSLTRLSRLAIRMSVNEFYHDQPARLVKELDPVAGNPVYAYHDEGGKFEDRMAVFAGPWKKKIENGQVVYEARKAALPSTRAQTVIVIVTGDPSLAHQVLKGINWKALQALIK